MSRFPCWVVVVDGRLFRMHCPRPLTRSEAQQAARQRWPGCQVRRVG